LFIVEEWVGEVDDVFMAIDVGHSGRQDEVSVKDDEDNQSQTSRLYIPNIGFQSSHLSQTDLSGLLSVHHTLNPDSSS